MFFQYCHLSAPFPGIPATGIWQCLKFLEIRFLPQTFLKKSSVFPYLGNIFCEFSHIPATPAYFLSDLCVTRKVCSQNMCISPHREQLTFPD